MVPWAVVGEEGGAAGVVEEIDRGGPAVNIRGEQGGKGDESAKVTDYRGPIIAVVSLALMKVNCGVSHRDLNEYREVIGEEPFPFVPGGAYGSGAYVGAKLVGG